LKQRLKGMIEQALEEELTEHLAARAHGRTAELRGYRNGHYRRRPLTPQGEIPDLAVPRAEEGGRVSNTGPLPTPATGDRSHPRAGISSRD
jgi:transposase-like protein